MANVDMCTKKYSSLEWVHLDCNSSTEVSLPLHAVSGGFTEEGEVTYVARAEIQGHNDIACGGYIPSRKVASVPYADMETLSTSCDILVCHDPETLQWVTVDSRSTCTAPGGAVSINTGPYETQIYIGRSIPGEVIRDTAKLVDGFEKISIDKKFTGPMLGLLYPHYHAMYFGHNGSVYKVYKYQVLCAYLPPPVQREVTSPYMWVPASHGYIPENGLVGGRTPDDEVTYVARVMYNDDYAIGYVVPSEKVGYFSNGLSHVGVVVSSSYEVMVTQHTGHFSWIPVHDSHSSESTVVDAQLEKQQNTYIGRTCVPFSLSAKETPIPHDPTLSSKLQFVGIVKFGLSGPLWFSSKYSVYRRLKYDVLVVSGKILSSLQELCRYSILDCTSGVPHRINELPLPPKMKEYCQLRSDESEHKIVLVSNNDNNNSTPVIFDNYPMGVIRSVTYYS